MSEQQIVTMPGTNEKFVIGTDGQLVPYVEPTVEQKVHEVPLGQASDGTVPKVSDDAVDLTAPIKQLRGNTAEFQHIDDAGFTNEETLHVNTVETQNGEVLDTEAKDKAAIDEMLKAADTMATVKNTVAERTDSETEQPQSNDTQNSEELKYKQLNASNLANLRYKVSSPVSVPIDPKHSQAKSAPIFVPYATQAEMDKVTDILPGLSDDVARTLNPEWVGSFYGAIEETNTTNSFVDSMKIPGSFWTQRIEHAGQNIGPKKAAIGDIREQKLTGAAAIYHMQNLLAAGTSVTHPFWASGFWLTLRNPGDTELNLLEETIKREKISVGRKTLGLAFNNQSVYLVKHVFNFIKQHIYETNIKDLATSENMDIGDLLKITDLFPLIQLLSCTIYPEGYPYKSPCLNTEPSKCGGVVTEMLQLFKMFWNKDSNITPKMRAFMANPQEKHTIKDILAYQKDVAENCSEVIDDINPGFKVVARIPTVNEYIDAGERWINEMVMAINNRLGEDLTDVARNALITKQARTTRLREYVHCFEKIIYTANEQVVDKRADIEAVFNVMSGNDELVNSMSDALSNFIARHTLTVVGIPNYVCPDCGKQHNPDISPEHSLFTPVDPLNLFFTLKDRKTFRAE